MVDQIADRPHHALEPRELRRRLRRDPRALRHRARARRSATTPPAPSASTPATAAARPAAATASSTSRCSSSPTCTCAARTATARRYRDEVLDIKREGANGRRASIADVLDMTVTEALAFFADSREVAARLAPLADVGLEYLKLGQPVPTLSGGEAQRLKLAGHLARSRLGRLQHHPSRQAVPVRRADHRPALRRRRQAAARVSQAARRRPLAAGDRAQPRRHPRLRLDHRPRPRGRRRAAARSSCTGTPAAGARARALAHRPGARRLREGAGERRPARRRRELPRSPSRPRPTASPSRQRRRGARLHRHPQRARAQPQEHRRRDPARQVHRHHRRLGLRQIDARLRHPLHRGPAPLSRIAERLRAPVRAAGGAPRRRRDLRHSADGRDRAAHQPRRPQEHGRDADRDLSLPAPAVREARHAVLPRLRRRHRAAERGLDRRAPAARLQGQAHRAARAAGRRPQGLLHRSRQVGRQARASRTCASTASILPTAQWPRLSRFKEHTIELPVAQIDVAARTRHALREALARALDFGKGVVHVLGPKSRPASRCSPPSAPAPPAAAASPSSTRACSRSTPSTAGARAASAPASR